ncbi:hypothetical protein U2F10_13645 [Leptothoe sp. EHU-05/26/07-4]
MSRLAQRIIKEFQSINVALERAVLSWQKFERTDDELYVDSAALNLQGAYNAVERLFEIIARDIDGERPAGNNWHQQLLHQMAMEMGTIRPAVISGESLQGLDNYRAFRHIVRHVYSEEFEAKRIGELVGESRQVFTQVAMELKAFASFLEQRSEL